MRIFETPITEYSENFTLTCVALNKSFRIHLLWDMNLQEQWNTLYQGIKAKQDSDPLINTETGDIIRDYDYLNWYADWTTDVVERPQSLKDLPDAVYQNIMLERQQENVYLKKIFDEMTDRLAWYIDISVDDTVYTGILRPQGFIEAEDSSWRLSFNTALEEVSYENLDQVTIHVEIEE